MSFRKFMLWIIQYLDYIELYKLMMQNTKWVF